MHSPEREGHWRFGVAAKVVVMLGLEVGGFVGLVVRPVHAQEPTSHAAESLAPSIKEVFDFVEEEGRVVWAASKSRQSEADAPAAVTVITQDDLKRWGFTSLEDVLRSMVGFYVVSDHVLPNAGVRGIAGGLFGDSGNLKVLINGHSVAFRSTGGNWLGPELVPISSVARIEIVRGPTSALYGADAFLGVINVVTMEGRALSGGMVTSVFDVTRFGHIAGGVDGTFGFKKGAFDFLGAAAVRLDDVSGLPLPSSSPSAAVPEYRRQSLDALDMRASSVSAFSQLAYDAGDLGRLSAFGYFSKMERGGEFGPWTPMSNGFDDEGRLNLTQVSLYQALFGLQGNTTPAEDLTLNLSLDVFLGGPGSDDRIEVGSDAFYVRRSFGNRGVSGEIDLRWTPRDDVAAAAGVEYQSDAEDGFSRLAVLKLTTAKAESGDIDEQASTRVDGAHLWNLGAFGQVEWKIVPSVLAVTSGVRLDYNGIYGTQLSGRVALVGHPLDGNTIKLIYGSAFKAPSPYLLYATPLMPGDVVGNPDLKPQYVHAVEVEVEQEIVAGLRVKAGAAYSMLRNKAEFVQLGLHMGARNIAAMNAITANAEARYTGPSDSEVYASIEYQGASRDFGQLGYQSLVMELGNPIYPDWIARFGASASVPGLPVRASVRADWFSSRLASDSNILALGSAYRLDSYATLNAEISTHAFELLSGRETRVAFIGRNLLDTRTADSGFSGVDFPQAPLTLFIQLSQEL